MIVEHFGNDTLQPILPVKNVSCWNKPEGGLWTSPAECAYSWKDWCLAEKFRLELLDKSFRLDITIENMLLIDSYCDFQEKVVDSGFIKIDIPSVHIPTIDFESLAGKYDGIYLTMNGQRETHFGYPYSIYGWDCETVLLFNNKAIKTIL